MSSLSNFFRAADFLKWYAEIRQSVRLQHQTGRFQPHFGAYLTRFSGQSLEFLDYSDYRVGDDPRLLSRRLFVRTRRWYIRRMHHRSPVRAAIVLDGTGSMFYPENREEPRSQKWVQQCVLAASLVREFLAAGDRCDVVIRGAGQGAIRIDSLRAWTHWLDLLETYRPTEEDHDVTLEGLKGQFYSVGFFWSDFIHESDVTALKQFLESVPIRRVCVMGVRHPTEQTADIPYPSLISDFENQGVKRVVSDLDRVAYNTERQQLERQVGECLSGFGTAAQLTWHEEGDHLVASFQSLLRWGEQ